MEQKGKEKGWSREQEGEKKKREGGQEMSKKERIYVNRWQLNMSKEKARKGGGVRGYTKVLGKNKNICTVEDKKQKVHSALQSIK
jgi:hypothetical protein